MLQNIISDLIVSGHSIGQLLFLLIGLVLVCGIVWWICKAVAAPQIVFTVLYVIFGLILLLVVFGFFFGSVNVGTGSTDVHTTR